MAIKGLQYSYSIMAQATNKKKRQKTGQEMELDNGNRAFETIKAMAVSWAIAHSKSRDEHGVCPNNDLLGRIGLFSTIRQTIKQTGGANIALHLFGGILANDYRSSSTIITQPSHRGIAVNLTHEAKGAGFMKISPAFSLESML